MPAPHVYTVAQPEELARHAAEHALTVLIKSLERHGSAVWVLAGGTSPLDAYRYLANEPRGGSLDWSQVSVVVGDERLVPFDHVDSNWGQIRTILETGHIRQARVVTPPTDLPLDQAARQFESRLRRSAPGDGPPRLDLVWLGVGEDGHTMSLFPGDRAIQDESGRLVLPVASSPKPPPERLTLSLRAMDGAQCVVVFGYGAAKRAAVHQAIGTGDLPIGLVTRRAQTADAEVHWLLDTALPSEAMR